jgi:CDP-Glycerol:Poly(glycerophosphate) glycerophosphotransferase
MFTFSGLTAAKYAKVRLKRQTGISEPGLMRIYFDTPHLYYLTQYLPVFREATHRGIECRFLFYAESGMDTAARKVIAAEGLPSVWTESVEEGAKLFHEGKPSWVIFGNAYKSINGLPQGTRTAMLYHGIGMKSDVYHPGLMEMDIRFVEGPHYTEILTRQFPSKPVLEVGYAKLDPLLGHEKEPPAMALQSAGLNTDKPTLLYAPTFYPSSIELMPDNLPEQFASFNLIVKPHNFTWSKSRYRNQRKKLKLWERAHNCHIPPREDFNLLPFMAVSDLMISDASAALFEFAALGKPVIWCEFLKLRWTYRGLFRYRLRRRMDATIRQYDDVCPHARSYSELRQLVDEQLAHPEQFQPQREATTARLIGKTDGCVSARIVDYLERHGKVE